MRKFEITGGSNSVSDIQDYFENILKNHGEKTDNALIRIYINKIGKSITFRIKTWYYLQLLTPETMKVFGITESKITKKKMIKFVSIRNYWRIISTLYFC